MKLDALIRAAHILRAQSACTMQLAQLHNRLVEEFGAGAGTYAELYQQLKNRPRSFIVVETPRMLGGSEGWPLQVREEYDSALSGAGLGSCIRVGLADISGAENNALTLASSTLGEIWPAAQQDATLREFVHQASGAIDEISALLDPAFAGEPPTTRPRDLPKRRRTRR